MGRPLTQKLIESHLADGERKPGEEIALTIDQTLTQDATGTLVMLELEALELDRVRTQLSAQYVDHNLIQSDFRNPDDHRFLLSACRRFGVWYSRPGNGVSHPVHMERFGVPGQTLLGSDSHTCAAGSLGMLAIGAGGMDVAMAMAGEPFRVGMPQVLGVELRGELPDWVSAKDVILEMLRRRGVDGGKGFVIEYHGPGVATLSAMDRHVIANMGAELGATTSIFPSDERTREFLEQQERGAAYRELAADPDPDFDEYERIRLDELEPLIALPTSPGNVVPVREVAGRPIGQAYVGSSANPGLRDFAVPAMMVEGRTIPADVSFDVNPTSRQVLANLDRMGHIETLVAAGARIHQAGCNGCIGMGQAPATDTISLRTVPRNFPGRSGTREDAVHLCSPETATASALRGEITDPRDLDTDCPVFEEPDRVIVETSLLEEPPEDGSDVELQKGPGIEPLPPFDRLPDRIEGPVQLTMGDDVSTDEIMPAGTRVLPLRSDIPEISGYTFEAIDPEYVDRVSEEMEKSHLVVAGDNYGQGSSREHAALAPRYLGLRVVIAKSFARIHRQNLINYGILPLTFVDPVDHDRIERGDEIELADLRRAIEADTLTAHDRTQDIDLELRSDLCGRECAIVRAGGLINHVREHGLSEQASERSA